MSGMKKPRPDHRSGKCCLSRPISRKGFEWWSKIRWDTEPVNLLERKRSEEGCKEEACGEN